MTAIELGVAFTLTGVPNEPVLRPLRSRVQRQARARRGISPESVGCSPTRGVREPPSSHGSADAPSQAPPCFGPRSGPSPSSAWPQLPRAGQAPAPAASSARRAEAALSAARAASVHLPPQQRLFLRPSAPGDFLLQKVLLVIGYELVGGAVRPPAGTTRGGVFPSRRHPKTPRAARAGRPGGASGPCLLPW